MTDDRFERLQRLAEQYAIERDAFEAKDRKINELHARIAELEAALKPFADAAGLYDLPEYDHAQLAIGTYFIVSDLRAARAAMEGKDG